jgi:hypothetical protein
MFKIILVVHSIIGFIAAALLIGRFRLSTQFDKDVMRLFSQSKNISDKIFGGNYIPNGTRRC